VASIHWWKKALWSRFVRAIGLGCQTGINNSGQMTVPVPARTGTDRSPRGRARSEGGVDHWSRFVARTGMLISAGFCVFLFIYLVCFVFNLMVLHIYSNNEGIILYIYILHIMVTNILFTFSSVVLGRHILQTVLTQI
jgi:hypothetical protein